MTVAAGEHLPVMLDEVIAALGPQSGGIYVDCTFGRGGHSIALLEQVGSTGRVVALDRDPEAVAVGRALAERESRFEIEHAWFSQLQPIADKLGISGRVNGILADLGVSSPQLDDARRGFSFQGDANLDMRMDPSSTPSAAEWLAGATVEEIAYVLKTYGEERFAGRIARRIVEARTHAPIRSTAELADLVTRAVPNMTGRGATGKRKPSGKPGRGSRTKRKHPATRTFLAIRIHVNRELRELEELLEQSTRVLAPHGRLAVISFHSLEDRMVKRFMRGTTAADRAPRDMPIMAADVDSGADSGPGSNLRPVGRPIMPSEREQAANPRSRSAVLRVAELVH